MGNTGLLGSACDDSLGSCLLSKEEFMALVVGSCFDHRDYEGRFALAQILQKNAYSTRACAYITYVGWAATYNRWVDYKKAPYDFAKAKSVSSRAASGPLQHYGVNQPVAFRPNPNNAACKWRVGHIVSVLQQSDQVSVRYFNRSGQEKHRWVHLDNSFEIDSLQRLESVQHGNKEKKQHRNRHGHHRHHQNYSEARTYPGNQAQHQTQQQAQMQRQDQMTVRTQLLLDDTHKQLRLTRNYLDAAGANQCSKKEVSTYNQKVVVGLTCFRMKVSGMRKNAKSEGIDFSDAFKSSSMVIKKFEREYRATYGANKFLMQRLEPCLNYMRAVLKGNVDIPPLPYVNEYEFNPKVASSVISSVAHAQNHAIPDRVKEVARHNEQYKARQKELRQQYEAEQDEDEKESSVKQIDYRGLIQDYNTNNIAFGDSKAKQQEIIAKQQQQYRFKEPNLVDGDDDGCDADEQFLANDEDNDYEMGF